MLYSKRYQGTLNGTTTRTFGDGSTVEAVWSVDNLRLKLRKVNKDSYGLAAIYKVTGGNVNFSQTLTGTCTYSVGGSFPLVPALPNPPVSEPLVINRSSKGRWYIYGGITVDTTFKGTKTCPDSESDTVDVGVPQLFDPMARRYRPGRRIRGTYRDGDTSGSGSTTTTTAIVRHWDLKPR